MLELDGVWGHYGIIPAVRGVSLTVGPGEVVALLGRNGAGKSTTLAIASGLKAASTGSVRLDGEDATRLDAEHRVRRGLVLVPEGRGIFPTMTVRENLLMGGYQRRLSPADAARELDRVTERFPRLTQRMKQIAGSLSGGEAQMLAVARGLMGNPRLLMLDEPSLGLAPVVVHELYGLLAGLRADGIGLLVVEQYAKVVLEIADRACVMHKGGIVLTDDAGRLRNSPQLVDSYMSNAAAVSAG